MTTEELTIEVHKALGNQTFLNSDGGDITLISIEDDKHVKVRLEGACTSSVCSNDTKAGVETTIKVCSTNETVVNIL
jgi:Fe-S cluster biogenesis protein NfuA